MRSTRSSGYRRLSLSDELVAVPEPTERRGTGRWAAASVVGGALIAAAILCSERAWSSFGPAQAPACGAEAAPVVVAPAGLLQTAMTRPAANVSGIRLEPVRSPLVGPAAEALVHMDAYPARPFNMTVPRRASAPLTFADELETPTFSAPQSTVVYVRDRFTGSSPLGALAARTRR